MNITNGIFLFLMAFSAYAEVRVEEIDSCASIEKSEGEVQILDPTKTQLVIPKDGEKIRCHSWISVNEGYALVRMRDGKTQIRAGDSTFFELGQTQESAVILYRGALIAETLEPQATVGIITANSKTTAKRGKTLVVYSESLDESQAIALEGNSRLENRFEPSRRTDLKAGEMSQLNIRTGRIIPSTPKIIDRVTLSATLSRFHFIQDTKDKLVAAVFAKRHQNIPERIKPVTKIKYAEGRTSQYDRFPASQKDGEGEQKWLQRLSGVPGESSLQISKRFFPHSQDKKKLLEDLSNIESE